MNRSPTQRTANKRLNSNNKLTQNHSPSNNNSTLYFCHYKNAMYMGGIKSFKKDGRGIMIHDSGLSIITTYLNDLMHGHNIFFAQHCLLSAEFVKGKIVEAVYRTDGFLVHLIYNNDGQLEGKCKLLNYVNKTITYATFRKGIMLEKQEQSDFTLLNKVFELGEFDFLVGRAHYKVIKYDFEKINNIEGQKYGNKLTLGFEKGGLINGLAFTIVFRGSHGGYNPDTHRNEDEFQLRVIERGYMANSQLNGFGQKWFKNGNLYTGQFKNGIFEGSGVLKNSAKKSWVSGYFEKGNLIDLLEYNNEGQQKRYDKIVQALHERKTNWINNEILMIGMEQFDLHIERILQNNPNSTVKSLQQRKQDVLRKIQDNFLCEPNSLPSFLQNAKNDLKLFQKQKDSGTKDEVKRYVNSFIPVIQKTREKTNDQNDFGDGSYKLSSSRRMPNSIRKSKIFERAVSSDNYLRLQNNSSRRNVSKTPQNKKKIFQQTTSTGFKTKFKENSHEEIPQLSNFAPKHDGPNLHKWAMNESSHGSNAGNSQASENQPIKLNSTEKSRTVGKSKIFKFMQNQSQQIAPKFVYTKVESMKQSQKQRRLGIEESS